MSKIIHYCWFGPKPLPKLAKKCIASWKKYLPNYEIKLWNEKNFDLNSCTFVKEAYENKKWAFVSDYVRLKALYNEGGIYLDTDMEILSDVSNFLDKEFFIGREYSGYIAAGVIGVKNPNNKYIGEMIEYYNNIKKFDTTDLFKFAIPKVITKILEKYESKTKNNIEIYNNDCFVYPVDYFYPVSYDRSTEHYSKNTCMIHYYDATWIPTNEKITLSMYRTIGKENAINIIKGAKKVKNTTKKITLKTSKVNRRTKKLVHVLFFTNKRLTEINEFLSNRKDNSKIMITNPHWIGVTNSAKTFVNDPLEIEDIYKSSEARKIAKIIVKHNPKIVIFSGFALRWWIIADEIKKLNKDIIVKVIWHGGNSLLIENNDFYRFIELNILCENKTIDEVGFLKDSMTTLFLNKGYKAMTLYNNINIDLTKVKKLKEEKNKENENEIKVGIYLSRDRWEKNLYTQLSSLNLIENVVADIVPFNSRVVDFAGIMKVKLDNSLSNEHIYTRLANNDINMYVTFTECAPLIPLESFELGVPCITGNNHEYWKDTELEKYLVVEREDDIVAIKDKFNLCLTNKEKVLELYSIWKKEYVKKVDKAKKIFLNEEV